MKKKKEIIPLINNEEKSYEKQKVCCICEKEFSTIKNTAKSEIIVITQEDLEELPTVFAIYDTKYQERFL